MGAAGGVAGGILFMASPEEAQAFRADRIIVGKSRHVPPIRQLYLKLEGLRDDLILKVELSNGTRGDFRVRPADWNTGIDRKLVGKFVLASDDDHFACTPLPAADGAIVFAARGRCGFGTKTEIAAAAGASSLVVYDEKSTNQPLEKQGKTGAQRSKGLANRVQGDILSGGAWMTPFEKGVTVMAPDPADGVKPTIDAVMMNRLNGTLILEALKSDQGATVLLVDRAEFADGIDRFLKKDLKKLIREMNAYNLVQRLGKGDKDDPLTRELNGITKEFEKNVRAKNFGEFQRTFKQWMATCDELAQFELNEIY